MFKGKIVISLFVVNKFYVYLYRIYLNLYIRELKWLLISFFSIYLDIFNEIKSCVN